MRSFLVVTALFLLFVVLLYGGLNLAEKGLADLAVIETEPGAFLIRYASGEGYTLVFAGRTATVSGEEIISHLQRYRDRLSEFMLEFNGKIFKRGNLDKRTGG